ncbi:MAG TPA: BldC family transcriptional regulator [Nocardioidaceae bacterium]|nr:BldC family transcriptional regulator [Nocardioidaceae bacterium]
MASRYYGERAPDLLGLMSPSEVSALFHVDAKTVARWSEQGKLHAIRTLGGHRRYMASEVLARLHGMPGR